MKRLLTALAASLLLATSASAQTTYTYEYDQFGRLIRVERNTGDSSRVRYFYDLAENRTKVKQGNSGPVAYNDYEFHESDWGVYLTTLLGNDTDADLPHDTLQIQSVSGTHASLATIQSGGQSIYLNAGPGTYYLNYTMVDSGGLTSSASVTVDIIPTIIITCPPDCW